MEILTGGTGELRFTGEDVIRGRERDHERWDFANTALRMIDGRVVRRGHRNLGVGPELTLMESSPPSGPPTHLVETDPDQPIIGRTAKR
jgi:hypothetical protein